MKLPAPRLPKGVSLSQATRFLLDPTPEEVATWRRLNAAATARIREALK